MSFRQAGHRSGASELDATQWGLRVVPHPGLGREEIAATGARGMVILVRPHVGAGWQVVTAVEARLLASTDDRDLAVAVACGAAGLEFAAAPWTKGDLEEIGVSTHGIQRILYCSAGVRGWGLAT